MLQNLLTGAVDVVFVGGLAWLAVEFVRFTSAKVAKGVEVDRVVQELFDRELDEMSMMPVDAAIEVEVVEIAPIEVAEVFEVDLSMVPVRCAAKAIAPVASVIVKPSYTIRQLKAMASSAGVPKYGRMKSGELMAALGI